jgi:hypothetical protein
LPPVSIIALILSLRFKANRLFYQALLLGVK